MKREKKKALSTATVKAAGSSRAEDKLVKEEMTKERMDASKEGRIGKVVDINAIIDESDRLEEEARLREDERIAHENEGLLSGEMV